MRGWRDIVGDLRQAGNLQTILMSISNLISGNENMYQCLAVGLMDAVLHRLVDELWVGRRLSECSCQHR